MYVVAVVIEWTLTSGSLRPSLRNCVMFFSTTDWNWWWVRSLQMRRIRGCPNLHTQTHTHRQSTAQVDCIYIST